MVYLEPGQSIEPYKAARGTYRSGLTYIFIRGRWRMSPQIKTWVKDTSGAEYFDLADVEKLVVNQDYGGEIRVTFEFWDFEGKRGEMTVPEKVAIVLARSILLCIEGSLEQIKVNL